jgi:hypothetical protein
MEVERHILETDKQFGLENIAFDPWQAELLGQRLARIPIGRIDLKFLAIRERPPGAVFR